MGARSFFPPNCNTINLLHTLIFFWQTATPFETIIVGWVILYGKLHHNAISILDPQGQCGERRRSTFQPELRWDWREGQVLGVHRPQEARPGLHGLVDDGDGDGPVRMERRATQRWRRHGRSHRAGGPREALVQGSQTGHLEQISHKELSTKFSVKMRVICYVKYVNH